MKWYQALLCVVINSFLFIPIVWELFSTTAQDCKHRRQHKKQIKTANEEFRKNHSYRPRRLCINCSYCRWKWYHPFGYRKNYWTFANKMPCYCKKFKKALNGNPLLCCISELDSQAMYEDKK